MTGQDVDRGAQSRPQVPQLDDLTKWKGLLWRPSSVGE